MFQGQRATQTAILHAYLNGHGAPDAFLKSEHARDPVSQSEGAGVHERDGHEEDPADLADFR